MMKEKKISEAELSSAAKKISNVVKKYYMVVRVVKNNKDKFTS